MVSDFQLQLHPYFRLGNDLIGYVETEGNSWKKYII